MVSVAIFIVRRRKPFCNTDRIQRYFNVLFDSPLTILQIEDEKEAKEVRDRMKGFDRDSKAKFIQYVIYS